MCQGVKAGEGKYRRGWTSEGERGRVSERGGIGIERNRISDWTGMKKRE